MGINGPLVMMNVEACAEAIEQIVVGQNATGNIDGVKFDWLVLSKTAFSVTLQGPTNRITIPVDFTDAYRKVIQMRTPLPTDAETPKRPGRPRRQTGSAAPVEQPGIPPSSQQPPSNPYLPPGYTGPFTGNPVAAQPIIQPQQPTVQPQQPLMQQQSPQPPAQPPRVMTIEEARGDEDWPQRSLDEAIEQFNEHVMAIITGVIKEATETAQAAAPRVSEKPKRLTCFDCVYADMTNWKCSKFDVVPPMHVIGTAVVSCSEFMEVDDEIPF